MSAQLRLFWSYVGRNETAKGLFLVGVVLLGAIGIWYGIRVALNTEFPVLVVSSGSMCQSQESSVNKCTLPIGSLIVIRGQDPSSIVVGPYQIASGAQPNGSIIIFRPGAAYNPDPNYLVVHRVVGRTSGGNFITRGDANGGACNCQFGDDIWDPSNGGPGIPPGNIVGVYQYTLPFPYLGSAILYIRGFMYDDVTGQPRPEGLAVIVLLIIALFAFEIIEPSKKKTPKPSPESETSPAAQPEEPLTGDPGPK